MQKLSELFTSTVIAGVLAVVFVAGLLYFRQSVRIDARQLAPYGKEARVVVFLTQIPAIPIPDRDHALIVAMRNGKRVTNAQLHRLTEDIWRYIRVQRRPRVLAARVWRYYNARESRFVVRLLRTHP